MGTLDSDRAKLDRPMGILGHHRMHLAFEVGCGLVEISP